MKGKITEYRPGRWRVTFYWKGKRYDFYKYTDGTPLIHERLAERLREHINYLIDNHQFDPSVWKPDRSFIFEKAVDTWIQLSRCSPDWIAKRQSIAEKILIPFFKGQDLREIRRIQIDEFLVHLKSLGYSDKYIYNIIGELKALFYFHRDSIPKMPSFPTISYQEPPIRWLTFEQQEKIFEFIPQEHLPIFTFMRYTGCRPNEAMGLLRENVFLKANPPYLVLATVYGKYGLKPNTKTRIAKPLPIIPEIEWTLKPREVSRYVFTKKGSPYTQRMLRYIWEKANKKAHEKYGVPIINLYNGLKHSFGCQRLNAGFSLESIKSIMGHTSGKTTERYAKYALEKLAPVMSLTRR
jgi:integrase